jgi:hypothetical protein
MHPAASDSHPKVFSLHLEKHLTNEREMSKEVEGWTRDSYGEWSYL